MPQSKRLFLILMSIGLSLLVGCTPTPTPSGGLTPVVQCAPNAISISVIYSPEEEQYMPQVMTDFNNAYNQGHNPVTGQPLASGENPICITGHQGSAGTVMQGIVNAVIAPNNANVQKPTLFSPSVSHWLALVNYQAGRQIFDLANSRPTALAAVVMAIWQSRLDAIRRTVGHDDIGWEELLQVFHSPNGWCDYGIPNCRRTVYYGHTDPYISSTALSTLIAEFYASARANNFTGRRLTLDEVNNTDVQQGVRDIEALIRHYSSRTTEFKEYIAQGPDYLDFVALEENDLIFINEGKTQYQPPEKLVALYPKEGTFFHEHPMGIANADWTTPEQRQAASVFVDYVLTPAVQTTIMSYGFRPANPAVQIGFPFVAENGVDPTQPTTTLDVPSPDVIAAIQQSWSFVKKQADIMLLIDVSGSMGSNGKLDQAKQAALAFLDNMEPTNRVGLTIFSDDIQTVVPLGNFESVQSQLRSQISALQPLGGTELYGAVQNIVGKMNEDTETNRIRAVVLLSDGADTGSKGFTLNNAVQAIQGSRDSLNPVIFIPVAYGADADINALGSLARASATKVQSGDPSSILGVLQVISSYF
jgi:Ca-activated chloride channel homolog